MKRATALWSLIGCYLSLGVFATLMAQNNAEVQAGIQEGRQLLRREEYGKVRALAQKFLAQAPRNPELYYLLGTSYLNPAIEEDDAESQKKLLAAAKAAYDKGVFYNTKFAYNFVGLGGVYALTGPYTECESNLKKAEETNPSDVDLLAAIARFYILAKKPEAYKNAEALLLRASQKDPKNAEISLALGELYFSRKRYEQALDYYKEALKKKPDLATAHYAIGVMSIEEKKYNEGIASLKEAVRLDPNYAPAYRALGEIYNLAGRYTEAADNFKKYLSMTSERRAQYTYAKSLYASGQYAAALEQIDIALKDTTTPVMLRLKAYCLTELKQYENALQAFDRYYQNFSGPYILKDFTTQADAYKGMKQDSMAILQLEKALALDPDAPEIHSELAKLHMGAKRYAKATYHMERVLAKGSGKPGDYFDLGKAYLAAEQYRKADSVLQILAQKAPTFTAGYLYLARVNYYLNTPEADTLHLPYYRKVIEGYSATPEKFKSSLLECYRALAGYYFEKKKYPDARPYVEKVLELAPEDATAVEQLDYIKKVAAMPGGGGRG